MSQDAVFGWINGIAIAGWLALLLGPLIPELSQRLAAVICPLLLAIGYVAVIGWSLGGGEGGGSAPDFTTLDGVAAIFSTRTAVLAGWAHYLAFDLFVGAWEARDARRRGLAHAVLIPALVLTFLSGPLGFLVYHALARAFASRPVAAA